MLQAALHLSSLSCLSTQPTCRLGTAELEASASSLKLFPPNPIRGYARAWPQMGTAPPYSSSSSSSSQMAASKGNGVVHPPACVVIMRTQARSACSRFSLRAVDLPHAVLRRLSCLYRGHSCVEAYFRAVDLPNAVLNRQKGLSCNEAHMP